MCSIYGAVGYVDRNVVRLIADEARDRGRDGGRMETYGIENSNGSLTAVLGSWRATPTPEVRYPKRLQPYDGMVHNGTIANDKELGGLDGEVDSQVLARVIDRSSVHALVESLGRVKGSYALACHNGRTVYLATNYKPLHYWKPSVHSPTVYFSSMERHFRDVMRFGQRPQVLAPYTAIDLMSGEKAVIPRKTADRVVVVCSGGLDSVTAAGLLKEGGHDVCLLHFAHGCRAETNEIRAVRNVAQAMNVRYDVVRVPYGRYSGGSPLLDSTCPIAPTVQGAEYAHEWVPARNLVFLSLAIAFAEANGYHKVALGNNLEEAGAYPDNEEQMTYLMDQVADYAVQNGYEMRVISPVGHLMKHEIVKEGLRARIPYELTWSCYSAGEVHCGECGPCFMRREAFRRNDKEDPVFSAVAPTV